MNNFSIVFGQKPENLIDRKQYIDKIVNDFCLDFPLSMSYIITGVRGSGKTVLLTSVGNLFEEKEDWIVVDINPEREILEQIASKLYESKSMKALFLSKSFSISFKGIGFSISGKEPVSNIKTVLDKMLDLVRKHNKKVILLIDEVSNSQQLKAFLHDYQSMLRDEFPVYLLMTGLTENVYSLQNSKTLTFLYRCPKIMLNSLDYSLISESYKNIFNINEKLSTDLALLTKGYPFAYQVVGYLFGKYKDLKNIILEYDQYLAIYVYDKIYSSLSEKEVELIKSFPSNEFISVKEILSNTKLNQKEFSVYRDRLIKRGLLDGSKRGYLSFTLPRFAEYLKKQL